MPRIAKSFWNTEKNRQEYWENVLFNFLCALTVVWVAGVSSICLLCLKKLLH